MRTIRLRWWVGAALALLLSAPGWGAAGVGAQPQPPPPPKIDCNSSVSGALYLPAWYVAPEPRFYAFDGVAGQTVSYQLNVGGPIWYEERIHTELFSPGGGALFPDLDGNYKLPATGSYVIGVYGALLPGGSWVTPTNTMPFTLWLRCSPPPATPTPTPLPPLPPPPTPTPEAGE